MTTKAQKQLASDLRALACLIGRLCDKHAMNPLHVNLQNAWRDLEETCSRQEKEHMAFGARLLRSRPTRRSTHATRVSYFMLKAVLPDEGPLKIASAVDAYTYRQDKVIGAAIRQALDSCLAAHPDWEMAADLPGSLRLTGNAPLLDALRACDYVRDLA